MNSKHTTLLLASLLAFALIANVNVGSVYATGGLDDEEEEEAIEELQNNVNELQEALGVIELNLTEGTNNIQANCPLDAEEIVEEVKEVVQNVTEELPQQTCPFAPEQNVTQPEPEPEPEPAPVQNITECPFAPQPEQEVPVVEENVTEVIEEVIENVTDNQPNCNIPEEIIPEIIVPPEEPEPVPEPPVQNVTEPDVPVCPFTGEPVQQQQPENNVTETEAPVQDEQEVATIEFEASCGCFVVDKSPEDATGSNSGSNNSEVGIGNPEGQEQEGLYY